jgi:hypothetical protein
MSTIIKRYFDTEGQAIKASKQRARTQYHTHYIYQTNEGKFYIRGWLDTNPLPVLKVRFDGEVIDLTCAAPQVQAERNKQKND